MVAVEQLLGGSVRGRTAPAGVPRLHAPWGELKKSPAPSCWFSGEEGWLFGPQIFWSVHVYKCHGALLWHLPQGECTWNLNNCEHKWPVSCLASHLCMQLPQGICMHKLYMYKCASHHTQTVLKNYALEHLAAKGLSIIQFSDMQRPEPDAQTLWAGSVNSKGISSYLTPRAMRYLISYLELLCLNSAL